MLYVLLSMMQFLDIPHTEPHTANKNRINPVFKNQVINYFFNIDNGTLDIGDREIASGLNDEMVKKSEKQRLKSPKKIENDRNTATTHLS